MKKEEEREYYLEDIKDYKMPSKEEEALLFEKIRNGDIDARNELIKRYQSLLIELAKELLEFDKTLELEDLISEANIYLIKAIERYAKNPEIYKNHSFRATTKVSIKSGLITAVLKNPEQSIYDNKSGFRVQLYNQTSSKEEYKKIKPIFKREKDISLDDLIDRVRDGDETIDETDHRNSEEELINKIYSKELAKRVFEIKKLTQKERFFLIYFFGFGGYPPMSFTELSKLTNKSKQYYHELLSKIMKKINNDEVVNEFKEIKKNQMKIKK